MKLEIFEGQKKDELSLIEVAHAILANNGEPMSFVDLANAVQNYLSKTDEDFRNHLSQFYTDLNVDGSFISLGENTWGLRTWYPFDSIDEAVNHSDEDEDEDRPTPKKRKRVNAFLADASNDDDVIDYDADDPEDEDDTPLDQQDDDNDDDYESVHDDSETLPDGIEGQLSEMADDDDDDDDE